MITIALLILVAFIGAMNGFDRLIGLHEAPDECPLPFADDFRRRRSGGPYEQI